MITDIGKSQDGVFRGPAGKSGGDRVHRSTGLGSMQEQNGGSVRQDEPEKTRVVILGDYPNTSGRLLQLAYANDLSSVSSAALPTMLVSDTVKDAFGRSRKSYVHQYTDQEYDALLSHCEVSGTHPVTSVSLYSKGGHRIADVSTAERPSFPFYYDRHQEVTERAKRVRLNQQSKHLEFEEREELAAKYGFDVDEFGDLDMQSSVSADPEFGITEADAVRLAEDLELD